MTHDRNILGTIFSAAAPRDLLLLLPRFGARTKCMLRFMRFAASETCFCLRARVCVFAACDILRVYRLLRAQNDFYSGGRRCCCC